MYWPNQRQVAAVVFFLLATFTLTAAAAEDLSTSLLNAATAYPKSRHTFSDWDSLNTYNGALLLSHEEFTLPGEGGLDIHFARHYHSALPDFLGHHTWQMHFGQIKTLRTGDLKNLSFQMTLPDGSVRIFLRQNSGYSEYITHDGWTGYRAYGASNFLVRSPDGKSYIFQPIHSAQKKRAIDITWGLARVTDLHNNWYAINYSKWRPIAVDASDGRHISLSYGGHGCRDDFCLTSLTVNGKTWQYYYGSGFPGGSLLIEARQPDGRSWHYGYKTFHEGTRLAASYLNAVTFPQGGRLVYDYQFFPSATGGDSTTGLLARVAFNKAGERLGTWTVSHFSSEEFPRGMARKVRVQTPEGQYDYHSQSLADTGSGYLLGVPLLQQTWSATGEELLQTERYEWTQTRTAAMYYQWSANRGDRETLAPRLRRKTVTVGNQQYETLYENFLPRTGLPQEVTEQGNRMRRSHFHYEDRPEQHLYGLLRQVRVNDRVVLQRDYTEQGLVSAETRFQATEHYDYTRHGDLTAVRDALGRETHYRQYVHGLASEREAADHSVQHFQYDAFGHLRAFRDEEGRETEYEYDYAGRLLRESPPLGAVTTVQYGLSSSEPAYILERGTQQTVARDDGFGRIVELRHSDRLSGTELTTWQRYNTAGLLTFQSQNNRPALGLSLSYDALGREHRRAFPYAWSHPESQRTQTDYVSASERVVTNAAGEAKTLRFQVYGVPEQAVLAAVEQQGTTLQAEHDDWGNLIGLQLGAQRRHWSYNANNCLIGERHPEASAALAYEVNALCTVRAKVWGNKRIDYQYDARSRLVAAQYSTGLLNRYRYDASGLLLSASNSDVDWTYEYDANKRLLLEKAQSPYFAAYQRRYAYDDLNQLAAVTPQYGSRLAYAVNALGQLQSIGENTFLAHYDAYGQRRQRLFAEVATDYRYNDYGLIETLRLQRQQTAAERLYEVTHRYDVLGHLVAMDNALEATKSVRATYDKRERLIAAQGPWGHWAARYDAADNIVQQQGPLGDLQYRYQDQVLTEVLNRDNESLYTLSYDEAGNVTSLGQGSHFVFDDNNQLLSTQGSVNKTYGYDAHGQLTLTRTASSTAVSLHDVSGRLIWQVDERGEEREFFFWQDELLFSRDAKGEEQFYQQDIFGNVIMAVHSTGALLWQKTYQPFGGVSVSAATGDNRRIAQQTGFVGKLLDTDLGLQNFGARHYHPVLGRFLSLDPAAVELEKPQSFNRYAYGFNNPYKYKDPDGRSAVQVIATGFGMATGFGSAWMAGERNPTNLFKATAVGGVVGLASTIPGGLAATIAVGAGTNAAGDSALKAWTGHADQITTESVATSAGLGAAGGALAGLLGKVSVPSRNLPSAPATQTNYIQQTVRQLSHNNSEVMDAARRGVHSTVLSGTFGLTNGMTGGYRASDGGMFNDRSSSFSGGSYSGGGMCYAPSRNYNF